jgi:hypothetical protein
MNNMKRFSEKSISEIESNLKLHINYKGGSSGDKYLKEMDMLTYNYSGARGIALSNMLNDYFEQVGVRNLDEALDRLRQQDSI